MARLARFTFSAALLAAVTVTIGAADKSDTQPELVQRIDPQYPPELMTSYLPAPVNITMTVDPKGRPFSLAADGSLPDCVVRALAQWQYKPARVHGQNVAFKTTLWVQVHRPMQQVRRSWTPAAGLVKAIAEGVKLDAAGAAAIEKRLSSDTTDLDERATLLSYYAHTAGASRADDVIKARASLIAALVEQHPEAPLLSSPIAIINAGVGPLADPAGYAHVRDLWLAALAEAPAEGPRLANASNFLRVADPEKAEQFLKPAVSKVANTAAWLGDVYGLAVLGVTSLDPVTGLPASAGERLPDSLFATHARAALKSTEDARVLLSAVSSLTAGGRELAKVGHLPAGYPALCEELVSRAKAVFPANAASCDITPPPQSPLSIPVGGKIQAAKLIRQAKPEYPKEAKAARIEGEVVFNAIIDKSGAITNLEFLRGPLTFYDVSREAVLQWQYQPTLLGGSPVEVETTINVTYTLSR